MIISKLQALADGQKADLIGLRKESALDIALTAGVIECVMAVFFVVYGYHSGVPRHHTADVGFVTGGEDIV